MGLLEEFQAQQPRQRGPRCNLGKLLSSLDDKTAAELAELLTVVDGSHTDLARFISAKWPDHAMKDGTVSRHRRGECSCDPG